MKTSTRISIALGALVVGPACLGAQTVSANAQARFAPGTTLPVILINSLRADRAHAGDEILARTTQPVILSGSKVLPASTRVLGHVLQAEYHAPPRNAFSPRLESRLAVVFDTVEVDGKPMPVHLVMRAIAAPAEVHEAQKPSGDADLDPTLTSVQVGGDRLTPAQPEVENPNGLVVGHQHDLQVSARLIASGKCDGGDHEVAVGIFSASACGAYGFGGLHVNGIGGSSGRGDIVLTSVDKNPAIWRNTMALLEVVAVPQPASTR